MIYDFTHLEGVKTGILKDFNIRVDMFTDDNKTPTNDFIFEAIFRSILETGNNRVLTFHSRSETESDKSTSVI